MAEVRQAAEESAGIARTMEYLREREAELSRYSGKLRESVERIANMFGDSDKCRICNGKKESKEHYKYRRYFGTLFTDELPECAVVKKENWQWTDEFETMSEIPDTKLIYIETKETHEFVPKIEISIDVEGEEFTTEISDGKAMARLCIVDHEMKLKDYTEGEEENARYWGMYQLSRDDIKRMVKERRITQLIELVKRRLDETTKEYAEVSQVAEKLASAL